MGDSGQGGRGSGEAAGRALSWPMRSAFIAAARAEPPGLSSNERVADVAVALGDGGPNDTLPVVPLAAWPRAVALPQSDTVLRADVSSGTGARARPGESRRHEALAHSAGLASADIGDGSEAEKLSMWSALRPLVPGCASPGGVILGKSSRNASWRCELLGIPPPPAVVSDSPCGCSAAKSGVAASSLRRDCVSSGDSAAAGSSASKLSQTGPAARRRRRESLSPGGAWTQLADCAAVHDSLLLDERTSPSGPDGCAPRPRPPRPRASRPLPLRPRPPRSDRAGPQPRPGGCSPAGPPPTRPPPAVGRSGTRSATSAALLRPKTGVGGPKAVGGNPAAETGAAPAQPLAMSPS